MKAHKFFWLLLVLLACNEKQPIYLNPDTQVSERVEDLLARMTLAEKIGQMVQVNYTSIDSVHELATMNIGSFLAIPGNLKQSNSPEIYADLYDSLQKVALDNRLGIPILGGIDAVHGHNNVKGTVIFPHNIGLGSIQDKRLIEDATKITAIETAATGFDWTFAPCIAVSQNERWGRTYESFSEKTELVSELGVLAIKGFQQEDLALPTSILACAKHYLGDGGTVDGKDRGDVKIDEDSLRSVHLPPYKAAVDAGVSSVMVSFSKWNGIKSIQQKYLLTNILKDELGFDGIVITDYGDVKNISRDNYDYSVEASINAGVDMAMMPQRYELFINTLIKLVKQNRVSEERIDDAVRRVLTKKFELGLFENPYAKRELLPSVGTPEHRAIARNCVSQSLVLLKNENNILPLSTDIESISLGGRRANDLGGQCGGWSIQWAGGKGQITEGTTVLQALEKDFPDVQVIENGEVGLVVIGEKPYAEIQGDRDDLHLDEEDVKAVKDMKAKGIPVVVILFSGRPMILDDILYDADAIVAAWLPGTEGQGITDVLFGKVKPTGKLSFSWPTSMDQIPINLGDTPYEPLYPFGYGLTY
ncbi:MAG: beta-glucosidase [Rickettsiales bacterium]|nr:beta-glucosidase [Rickettsiales bacterium]